MEFDTYSPKELSEFLSELKLEGLKIEKIESQSHVYDSEKRLQTGFNGKKHEPYYIDANLDRDIVISFDDGRMVAFDFSSVSHVSIKKYSNGYKLETVQNTLTQNSDPLWIQDVFPSIIGKTIKEYFVQTVNDPERFCHDYWDGGINEKQNEYIFEFGFSFSD